MTTTKRFFTITALVLGCLGVLVCLAGMVQAWRISSQLRQTTDRIFEKLDGAVVIARDRTVQMQENVETSKVTAEEIATKIKDWAKRKVEWQVALQLDIENKAERLASVLQQADHYLAVSESSVELVRQTLSWLNSVGASADSTAIDQLAEKLSSLRDRLGEATKMVTGIHDRTAEKEEKPLGNRLEQVVPLAVSAAATLGKIDSRLEKLVNRLSQTQENLRDLKAGNIRHIWLMTIVGMLLILWMAVGQIALCRLAYNALVRGKRTSRTP